MPFTVGTSWTCVKAAHPPSNETPTERIGRNADGKLQATPGGPSTVIFFIAVDECVRVLSVAGGCSIAGFTSQPRLVQSKSPLLERF